MKKDWYDKYGKEFHCADCTFLDSCLKKDEPLYSRCCEQYLRDRIAELEEQLKNAIILPKELQVGNKVFWANEDGLFIGEIKTISKDTTVWFYVVYDNRLTYWHLLEDFNNEVFATKAEAEAKLRELQGEKK